MQTVTFMRGLSASGKSTVAKQLVDQGGYVRVNMDDIRSTLALPFSKDNENLALDIQDQIILRALRAGNNVVVDNVHLHGKWPRRIAVLLWEAGIAVDYEIDDLMSEVTPEVCIYRNAARIAAGRSGVPDHVIPKQAKEWAKELQRGPWTVESITRDLPVVEPYGPRKWQLPECLILDIDGTIARRGDRGPFDFDRLDEDTVWSHVDEMVERWRRPESEWDGHGKVIVLTGRSAEYQDATSHWLRRHGIQFDEIYTRAAGDQRRDSVVKLELFNEHIRNRFDVRAVLDDRLRVCRMWNQLGLPLFRVGDPDNDF